MNQKKYLLVSAGVHGAFLLVLLILPVSSLTPKKPQPPALKINLQSAASIEAVLRQQTLQTTPPPLAPEPVLVEPEPAKVEPPRPDPKPKPIPKPEKSQRRPAPAPPKPKVKPKKPPQTKPKKPETKNKPDFNKFKKIERSPPSTQISDEAQRQQRERAAKAAQDQWKASQIIRGLQNSSGPSDIGDMSAGIALENWRQFVGKFYDERWKWGKQTEVSNSHFVAKAKVVINLDGSVASAQIVHLSGVDELDDSVQDVLDRVRKIGKKPPSKASIKDRTFTITFNLKDGRINAE